MSKNQYLIVQTNTLYTMKKIVLTTLVVVIAGFVMFSVGGALYYMDAMAEMAAAFPDAMKA